MPAENHGNVQATAGAAAQMQCARTSICRIRTPAHNCGDATRPTWPSPLRRHPARFGPGHRFDVLTANALANSYSEMIVGLRCPFSRPLMYCWLKPDFTAPASSPLPLGRPTV